MKKKKKKQSLATPPPCQAGAFLDPPLHLEEAGGGGGPRAGPTPWPCSCRWPGSAFGCPPSPGSSPAAGRTSTEPTETSGEGTGAVEGGQEGANSRDRDPGEGGAPFPGQVNSQTGSLTGHKGPHEKGQVGPNI